MQLLVENGDISFKDKSESHIRLFVTPWTYTVYGILRARILERVAFPFSRGSSQPRGQTQILHCRQILYQLSHKGKPRILEWVGYPFSSRSSHLGIEPESPALQVDSLQTELSGKLSNTKIILTR